METITAEDIAEANAERLAQLTRAARWVSTGVLVAGAIVCAGWAWYAVRTQMAITDRGSSFTFTGESGTSLIDRLDAGTLSLSLLAEGAIALVLGTLGLVWSSQAYAALGRSLHGAEVGDAVPTEVDIDLQDD